MPTFTPARLLAVKEIPQGADWLYEPKFDGYRGLLVSNARRAGSVWSRNAKDLGRFFPELVELASRLPPDTVLDGEIVRPTETGVSFIQLQRRLMVRHSEREKVGRESPVAFVAFDLLQRRSEDIRDHRLRERRRDLQRLVERQADQLLQVVIQTTKRDVAAGWLDPSLSMSGIEGVVAKRDEAYPKPDAKRWRKVRRVSTMEFNVHGFIPERDGSLRLVLAAKTGNETRIVGTTYPIGADDSQVLRPLIAASPPGERRIWAPFESERHDVWYQLPAGLIAEVVITNLDSNLLRQPARFMRWRLSARPPVLGSRPFARDRRQRAARPTPRRQGDKGA
jgi:ATP-dependent DNA ligase